MTSQEIEQKVWHSRILYQLWNSVDNAVWAFIHNSVCNSVWSSVWDSVRNSVSNSVSNSVWDSAWDSVQRSINSKLAEYDFTRN